MDFVLSFIALYRLNKTVFRMVYEKLAVKVVTICLLSTLRLAVAFQGVIANGINLSMGHSTLCKMLWNVYDVFE